MSKRERPSSILTVHLTSLGCVPPPAIRIVSAVMEAMSLPLCRIMAEISERSMSCPGFDMSSLNEASSAESPFGEIEVGCHPTTLKLRMSAHPATVSSMQIMTENLNMRFQIRFFIKANIRILTEISYL